MVAAIEITNNMADMTSKMDSSNGMKPPRRSEQLTQSKQDFTKKDNRKT